MSGAGHNSVAADELRQFVEQYESLEEEKQAVAERQREVKAEAKARGYDMKAFAEVLKLRKLDAEEREEREALRTLYADALGVFS
jgi:uncharacterized protein (UPF0335 family)